MGMSMLRRVTDRHTYQKCRRLRHAVSKSFAAAIALGMIAGCSDVLAPGSPPGDPTPLFGKYRSYSTFDDLKAQLPDRSRWKIVADLKHPAHGACPPFDYLRIEVPAADLGHKGRLEASCSTMARRGFHRQPGSGKRRPLRGHRSRSGGRMTASRPRRRGGAVPAADVPF
jgi:hypothetical protein